MALCAERQIILFCISVSEHCISALLSPFTSTLVRSPVEYFHFFEGATVLAESAVFLPLPEGVDRFVAHVGLHSVVLRSHIDSTDDYLHYHSCREVDLEDRFLHAGSRM